MKLVQPTKSRVVTGTFWPMAVVAYHWVKLQQKIQTKKNGENHDSNNNFDIVSLGTHIINDISIMVCKRDSRQETLTRY